MYGRQACTPSFGVFFWNRFLFLCEQLYMYIYIYTLEQHINMQDESISHITLDSLERFQNRDRWRKKEQNSVEFTTISVRNLSLLSWKKSQLLAELEVLMHTSGRRQIYFYCRRKERWNWAVFRMPRFLFALFFGCCFLSPTGHRSLRPSVFK